MSRERFSGVRDALKARARRPETVDASVLDSEPYGYAGKRPVTVHIVQPEFTALCPMTGLPDHGTVTVDYEPAERIVELQSLKFYLVQYRDVGIFYEHAVNRILDDLVALLSPRRMTVSIAYTPRGGISTSVTAVHPTGRAQ
jgi:7-cyano-7-deazaguanine reductase